MGVVKKFIESIDSIDSIDSTERYSSFKCYLNSAIHITSAHFFGNLIFRVESIAQQAPSNFLPIFTGNCTNRASPGDEMGFFS